MFNNPFKQKTEPLERKCILEHSIHQQVFIVDGITFFNDVEDSSSTIGLGNLSFDQYIHPLQTAVGQFINPSQQSSSHQYFFNPNSHHTPPPVMDPQKEQQIISDALNTIKTYISTWNLKSLRLHYLQNYPIVDKLLIELRKCFETQGVTLEQQIIILYITHRFAIATCAPQLVMEVLAFGTNLLPSKNTSPATSLLLDIIPTNIIKAKLHRRNIGAIITKILAITLENYEKNSTFKLPENWKGKLLMFEEVPFLITTDVKRLFETMRRFVTNKTNANGVKEKVTKAAMKYLHNLLDRNLLNLNWMKLSEAHDQILSYVTFSGIPDDLSDILSLQFLIVKEGEAASIMNLKRIFSEKTEKEDDIKRSVLAAVQYFLRIMTFYNFYIDGPPTNHHMDNFAHHHNLSRFNFIKDFFILSTELVQNLDLKNLSLTSVIPDVLYCDCLTAISQVLCRYIDRYEIESDLWVEMENSTRAYMEKVSTEFEGLIPYMRLVQINIAFGLMNSTVQLPEDWRIRSMDIHLGKIKKGAQDIDSASELFEKMSISDCSDSKDSFCSSVQDDPSTMFSRIFPDEYSRTIEHIESIYFDMFQHSYYREEKYPWIENLCIDQGKRQTILFALCSVLRIIFLHCGPTSPDTLRRIHQEVENTISYKKNTNDYNSVSSNHLKSLLKDVLLHTDQLMQISTLNSYYKTIEEGHTQEYYAKVNDVFDAIFRKKNHFNEMFRLTSLAHSFSRHLDYLLDDDARIHVDGFLQFPHRDVSLVFNLESCGIEVFQSIIFKLLNIHAKFTSTFAEQKIIQIIQTLSSPYYRNIMLKCVMDAAVRVYFDRLTDDQEIFKISLAYISQFRDKILGFYENILKTGLRDSSMATALMSHAITTLKNYFTDPSAKISFDSRMIILSTPDIFSSNECAQVIASRSDVMELLLNQRHDQTANSLLYYMFRSSILKLAYDYSLEKPNILINNADYSNLCKIVVEQGLRQFGTTESTHFKTSYDEVSKYFTSVTKQCSSEIPWNSIIENTDNMLLHFAKYWILQKHPDILIERVIREFTLPLEEVVVYKADYYRKEALKDHLGSIVAELISDLSSNKTLLLKPTTWLIGAVEALSENSNISQETYFELFKASINRLAGNDTSVDLLVLLCRFLIKRPNTWETYLGKFAQTLQNSQLQQDLDTLRKKLEQSIIKTQTITLHKYCLDLFQMVCIATRKYTLVDAASLLDPIKQSPLLSSALFDSNGETPFFKSFNMLVQILKNNLNSTSAITSFSETYSKVLPLFPSVAMRNLNTPSLIPNCKYIQQLLEHEPIATLIIRNTNFSLFYCSNSNSKLLLTPCIKNSIPFLTKKKALLAELNIFAVYNQGITCTSGSLFLSKKVVGKTTESINYNQFRNDPITVFRKSIGNMKFTHTEDYSYLFEVEGLFEDNTRHGIANIIIFNQVVQELSKPLPEFVSASELNSRFFVMGCLLGASLLCKYNLGPLPIDTEILQSFVDGVGIPQGNPKYEMAANFGTGLRSVLGDDLANFLKIFTAQEIISLTCDCQSISQFVEDFLSHRVDRDADVNEETSNHFLNLLAELVSKDIFVATLLLNYLDAIFTGMDGRVAYSLNIIPHDYKTLQINRSQKTVDISVCYSVEELKHLILNYVRIQQ